MNGIEHYRNAERLLAAVLPGGEHGDGTPIVRDEPNLVAVAQVHATLALAAAIGGLNPAPDADARWPEDEHRWREIVAPERVEQPKVAGYEPAGGAR